MFDLSGRTAMVTGCTRGIGLAIADAMAAAGADIIGVSASLETGESVVRSTVEGHGRRFFAHPCDLARRGAVYELVAELGGPEASVDILVNNAGIIHRRSAVDHEDDQWDRVLEVNLTASFLLARELGRTMLARGSGRIIFIASVLSFQGGIGVPGYVAAKSGIAGLTRALANEWAAAGVNVNAIAPGYIVTDNTEPLRENPSRYEAISERIPAGRWGTPEDLKGAAVFLASPASNYVHGTIVTVDGGWMGR
jgi:2-dehydro-3-deoxy-D-gluconate 5-dehydrogenase